MTTLPEYTYLKGTKDFTGHPRDGFYLRGLGGVRGQPVSSVGEEQFLGSWESKHPWYPLRCGTHSASYRLKLKQDEDDFAGGTRRLTHLVRADEVMRQ